MGRYRPLNGINDPKGALRGHMERAAINTPIQVCCLMLPTILVLLQLAIALHDFPFSTLLSTRLPVPITSIIL